MDDLSDFLNGGGGGRRYLPRIQFAAGKAPELKVVYRADGDEDDTVYVIEGKHQYVLDVSRMGWGWISFDPSIKFDLQTRPLNDLINKRLAPIQSPGKVYDKAVSLHWLLSGFDFLDQTGPVFQMSKPSVNQEGRNNTWFYFTQQLHNAWKTETNYDENKALKVEIDGFTWAASKNGTGGYSSLNITKQRWIERPSEFDEAAGPAVADEIPFEAVEPAAVPAADNVETPF